MQNSACGLRGLVVARAQDTHDVCGQVQVPLCEDGLAVPQIAVKEKEKRKKKGRKTSEDGFVAPQLKSYEIKMKMRSDGFAELYVTAGKKKRQVRMASPVHILHT